jgi:serine/arginine repetitive matrix protein 1
VGFFHGTSAEQNNWFSNKQKKLLKQLKFAECLEKKNPDSKMMQINLTGILNGKNAREFMGELWPCL